MSRCTRGRHRLRSVLAATVALGVLTPLLGLSPVAEAAPITWYPWSGEVGGTFRSERYDAGQWIYTNTLDQGRGANADRIHREEQYGLVRALDRDAYGLLTYDLFGVHRTTHNGDLLLPTDRTRWPDFSGELSELRLAVVGSQLHVRFTFPSMSATTRQIATLTFAPVTGAPAASPWPAGAGVRSSWTTAITTWGTGASITTSAPPAGAGGGLLGGLKHALLGALAPAPPGPTKAIEAVGGAVRPVDHAIELQLPLSALPPGPWRLTGGAGLAKPGQANQYWPVLPLPSTPSTPGVVGLPSPAVWSLLFADDTPWSFDERRQADLLATGDVSSASAVVDVGLLQSGATVAAGTRLGRQSRLFSSSLDLGDGIRRGVIDFLDVQPPFELPVGTPLGEPLRQYEYTGRLQHYSLQVPQAYASIPGDLPLIVYLHGLNGTPEEPFGAVTGLPEAADARGYLLAGALGRGDLLYQGAGELDVLEVIADIAADHRVDPDRIYLMGHSMGGQGTYEVALRNPDAFAAMAPAQGVGPSELWRNGRNVPVLHLGATLDADFESAEGRAFYELRSAQGWDSTLLNYESKTHEYAVVYDTLPRLFSFFEAHVRDATPAVVSYRARVGDVGFGLDRSGAYWVDGLTPLDAARDVSVEAETFGAAHARPSPVAAVRSEALVDEGGTSGKDTRARLLRTQPVFGPVLPAANHAEISLANAAAVSLDLVAMSLSVVSPLELSVATDGPVAVRLIGPGVAGATLLGGPPGATVTVDGADLIVHLPAGAHTASIG